jgi:hypothetical protein
MMNVVKAGSAVPVKFSLGGYQGLNIFAAGYPAFATGSCSAGLQGVVDQTVSPGSNNLSYDPTTDEYIYVWKTDKYWVNSCRTLVVKLNDGTYHRADFQFPK